MHDRIENFLFFLSCKSSKSSPIMVSMVNLGNLKATFKI